MSSANNSGLGDGLSAMASAIATLVVVLFVASIFLGGPFLAGVFGGVDSAVAWTGVLAAVAYIGLNSDEFGVGFAFTSIAVLLLLTEVLPAWMTEPFAFISDTLIGGQLSEIDPVRFAVLVTATVLLYWAVTVRLFGRGKKPSTVTKRLRIKAEQLAREYFTIARVVFAFGFSATALFLSESGALAGEATSFISDAPVVFSNIVTGILGYVAIGGGVPEVLHWIPGLVPLANTLGGIGPTAFLFVAAVVLALAYGTRET